jgi:hypothetical protein
MSHEWLDDYEIISGNNAGRDKAASRVTTIVFGGLDSENPQHISVRFTDVPNEGHSDASRDSCRLSILVRS